MAYMSQEKKAELQPRIKACLAKHGFKGTVSVRHHSILVLNITAGRLDLIADYNRTVRPAYERQWGAGSFNKKTYTEVNPYHWRSNFSTPEALAFFEELFPILYHGNWDRSDTQTDYFDVGWYVDVNVGKWNRPYAFFQQEAA